MSSNMCCRRFVILLCLFCFIPFICCTVGNSYSEHDRVPVVVNTIGPFHNPAETYPYYSFPYCSPLDTKGDDSVLGEVLAGDRRRSSNYKILYKIPIIWSDLCHFSLSQNEIKQFRDSIAQHYVFEMFIDDLSIKGFVGEIEESSTNFADGHIHNETHFYLFTHLDFSIAYNNDRIISVNLTTDPSQRVELTFGKDIPVQFSYSARWIPSYVSYEERITYHQQSAIGEQSVEIHWLSIINSFVLVILLTAFLAVILMRVLRKDFARYMELDEEDNPDEEQDEVGWKLVHGDVFRFPKNIMLLSSAIGNGAQFLVLVISLLLLALLGTFYPGNRGAIYSAAVLLYALTAFIAGYVSTNIYIQFGGTKWASNSLLTATLFSVPFFITFCVLNSVAWSYGSSSALPAATIIAIIALYCLVCFPLTIFGSMRARHSTSPFEAPCKTNRVEREIPSIPWYRSAIVHYLIAGFLPFSAIYIELHYLFAAIWGHRVYTLFGILSLAFIMLIIVTAFITIALTYFQLASEDYHWWWRSFVSGCSAGAFMYVYAIYYYIYRSEMSGMLQSVYFFGYMAMISYSFGLLLGTCSFIMAKTFVTHIYKSIKVD